MAETGDNERIETEEERRERIRRMRRRREIRRRRRRRKKILRLVRFGIIAAIIIAVLVLVISTIRKARRDQDAANAQNGAGQETDVDRYDASEVLHLTFPVLTLDQSVSGSATSDAAAQSTGDADAQDAQSGGNTDAQDETDSQDTEESDAAQQNESESTSASSYQTPLTVSEFQDILQDLYDQNYVLVNIYDLVYSGDDGFTGTKVAVPKGKKPLIISEQDASYQSGYDGHPDQMTVDDSGNITCIATKTDGTTVTGAYDIVPCVEDFISAHPDFSYKGARGIIGVTGYRGILGYKIVEDSRVIGAISNDAVMQTENSGNASETAANADDAANSVNSQSVLQEAKKDSAADLQESLDELAGVVSNLRGRGWQFACNSYDNLSYAGSFDLVKADVDKWEQEDGKALGTTDILLLSSGGDLDGWRGYQDSNEKYQYLQQQGFRYYCVENDAERTWAQIASGYLRLGMHEIESMRDYKNAMQLPA